MTLLSVLASFFGVVMGFANMPQAYKIFKRKSAKDISVITYSLFAVGSILWLFYGIEIGNTPIIASYSIGIVSCFAVLVGWYLYK